jgi:hypothetical protein
VARRRSWRQNNSATRPEPFRALAPDIRAIAQQDPRSDPFHRVDEPGQCHHRRIFHQEVDMILLPVTGDKARAEVFSDLGKSLAQSHNRISVEMAAAIGRHKDQRDMEGRNNMTSAPRTHLYTS